MMVGGAMFPQCLPRRSADSLSPSRISMKSYLGGDSEKDTDEQKVHLKIWEGPLSSFFPRHSGAAVIHKRHAACFGTQANTDKGSCFQATPSECMGGTPYLLFPEEHRLLSPPLRISEQAWFVLGWQ